MLRRAIWTGSQGRDDDHIACVPGRNSTQTRVYRALSPVARSPRAGRFTQNLFLAPSNRIVSIRAINARFDSGGLCDRADRLTTVPNKLASGPRCNICEFFGEADSEGLLLVRLLEAKPEPTNQHRRLGGLLEASVEEALARR